MQDRVIQFGKNTGYHMRGVWPNMIGSWRGLAEAQEHGPHWGSLGSCRARELNDRAAHYRGTFGNRLG